jgi:hypothetical protein
MAHGDAQMGDLPAAGVAQDQAAGERGQRHQAECREEPDCPRDEQESHDLGGRQQQECDCDPFAQMPVLPLKGAVGAARIML